MSFLVDKCLLSPYTEDVRLACLALKNNPHPLQTRLMYFDLLDLKN
jgi:hypothetical protein